MIPALISGVSAVGGLISGARQANQNQQLINQQNQQLRQVTQMAQQMAHSTNRAAYQEMANQDVNATLKDVFGVMASRGMGRSTAALTAAAGASGQIRSTYGRQFLQDRLSSIQGAGSMIAGVANSPRLGYDASPFAGFNAAMSGVANGFAYWQQNRGQAAPLAAVSPMGPYQPGTDAYSSRPISYKY